jgi:hypothetical protein
VDLGKVINDFEVLVHGLIESIPTEPLKTVERYEHGICYAMIIIGYDKVSFTMASSFLFFPGAGCRI